MKMPVKDEPVDNNEDFIYKPEYDGAEADDEQQYYQDYVGGDEEADDVRSVSSTGSSRSDRSFGSPRGGRGGNRGGRGNRGGIRGGRGGRGGNRGSAAAASASGERGAASDAPRPSGGDSHPRGGSARGRGSAQQSRGGHKGAKRSLAEVIIEDEPAIAQAAPGSASAAVPQVDPVSCFWICEVDLQPLKDKNKPATKEYVRSTVVNFAKSKNFWARNPFVFSDDDDTPSHVRFTTTQEGRSVLSRDLKSSIVIANTPCPVKIHKGDWMWIHNVGPEINGSVLAQSFQLDLDVATDGIVEIARVGKHFRVLLEDQNLHADLIAEKTINLAGGTYEVSQEVPSDVAEAKSAVKAPAVRGNGAAAPVGAKATIKVSYAQKKYIKLYKYDIIRKYNKEHGISVFGLNEDDFNTQEIIAQGRDASSLAAVQELAQVLANEINSCTEKDYRFGNDRAMIPDQQDESKLSAFFRQAITSFTVYGDFDFKANVIHLIGKKDDVQQAFAALKAKVDGTSMKSATKTIKLDPKLAAVWTNSGNKLTDALRTQFKSLTLRINSMIPKGETEVVGLHIHCDSNIIQDVENVLMKKLTKLSNYSHMVMSEVDMKQKQVCEWLKSQESTLQREHNVKLKFSPTGTVVEFSGSRDNVLKFQQLLENLASSSEVVQIEIRRGCVGKVKADLSELEEQARQQGIQIHGVKNFLKEGMYDLIVEGENREEIVKELRAVGTTVNKAMKMAPFQLKNILARQQGDLKQIGESFDVYVSFAAAASSLIIIGREEKVNQCFEELTSTLEASKKSVRSYKPKSFIMNAIMFYGSKQQMASICGDKKVQIDISKFSPKGYTMRGTVADLTAAVTALELLEAQLLSKFAWDRIPVKKEELQLLNDNSSAKSRLQKIQTQNNAIIRIPSHDECMLVASIRFASSPDKVIEIRKGDITKSSAEVIVNAANGQLEHGGGVAKAIADAAGSELVIASANVQGKPIADGEVAVTPAGKLFAHSVIHAVGPHWNGGNSGEQQKLKRAYLNSLQSAATLEAQSIAFPLISSQIFGVPPEISATTFVETAYQFLFNPRCGSVKCVQLVELDEERCVNALKTIALYVGSRSAQLSFDFIHSAISIKAAPAPVANAAVVQQQQQQWYYRNEDEHWTAYVRDDNKKIISNIALGINVFDLEIAGAKYRIDLRSKQQTRLHAGMPTGVSRPISNTVPMETSGQWEWRNEDGWRSYSVNDNVKLENAYMLGEDDYVELGELTRLLDDKKAQYRVWLKKVKPNPGCTAVQENIATKFVRDVRRQEVQRPAVIIQAQAQQDVAEVVGSLNQAEDDTLSCVLIGGIGDTVQKAKKELINLVKSFETQEKYKKPLLLDLSEKKLNRIAELHRVEITKTKSGSKFEYQFSGFVDNVQNAIRDFEGLVIDEQEGNSQQGQGPKLPTEWTFTTSHQAPELFSLDSNSSEYQKIDQLVKASVGNKIVSIQRVQNKKLWIKYQEQKERVAANNSGNPNERLLFHGTRNTDPETIWKNDDISFDFRLSQAGMWGRGAYFAERCKYSATDYKFTPSNDRSIGQFFVAQVALGDCVTIPHSADSQKYLRPPLKSQQGTVVKLYDSVHGVTSSCTDGIATNVYIVYEFDRAYPAYLVTFKL